MTWIAPSTDFRALSKWCAVLYLPVSMLNEDRSTPGSKKKSGSFPNSAIRCYSGPSAKTQAQCDGCPAKGKSIVNASGGFGVVFGSAPAALHSVRTRAKAWAILSEVAS
jgi:hypothetical protein